MAVRIHHLNLTTLRPPCAWFINGKGGLFSRGRLVCHSLLIESNDGLILVDTGLGLRYVFNREILGKACWFFLRAPADPDETAARQVVRLGFTVEDVRHIVMTHLDLDHAGGLPDFPDAEVHVLEQEYKAAMNPETSQEQRRYIADQWAHKPRWVVHELKGEKWFGFENAQEIIPEVILFPMIGHSRGHCGVAVDTSLGWSLHCGDAYTDRAQIDDQLGNCALGARMHRRSTAVDPEGVFHYQKRLRKLVRDHGDEITIFCSHDPVEFDSLQNTI